MEHSNPGLTYSELITGRRRRPSDEEKPLEDENEKTVKENE